MTSRAGSSTLALHSHAFHPSGIRQRESEPLGGIDTALISLASRPTVLDTQERPKALLPLAGEPVLAHVLRQLWLGGIVRVVLVLGAAGPAIRAAVAALPLAAKLQLHFLELGAEYAGGFARSLLPARATLRAHSLTLELS